MLSTVPVKCRFKKFRADKPTDKPTETRPEISDLVSILVLRGSASSSAAGGCQPPITKRDPVPQECPLELHLVEVTAPESRRFSLVLRPSTTFWSPPTRPFGCVVSLVSFEQPMNMQSLKRRTLPAHSW